MYRNLNHFMTLAALADSGSFAGAARQLGLPTSTVSEHIAALERNLGLQLVIRTTRQSRLTEQGRRLAASAGQMTATVREIMAIADSEKSRPQGRLRVSLPFAFAADLIGPAVGRFCQLYPGISLEFEISNDVEDLIAGGFDLAVRIGPLADSSLIRRRIGSEPQLLVAARSYLAAQGTPAAPEDLAHHCLIGRRPQQTVPLEGPGGLLQLQFDARVAANDPKAMHAIVRGAGGIAMLPRFLIERDLADGALEVVLPAWRPLPIDMSIVHYGPSAANPRVDLFASFVVSELAAR